MKRWSHLRPWHTNAALVLLGWGLIAWTRRLIVEYDTVHNYVFGFDGVAAGSLTCYLAAVLVLYLYPRNTDRATFPIILGVALLARLVALFPEPALSSDVYRYAWDGVVQHAHINPYRYVPGNPILTFLREPNQDLFDNMNRRDYAHTIYPPVAQIMFYCITWINGSVTAMKAGMVLFEGITLTALVSLLRKLGVCKEWSLLYSWCPLLIWEIAGSGHLDSICMAFIALAMLFRYRRQPALVGLFLGLAIFTKFYPAVLIPALYTRRDWKMPTVLVAVGAVSYSLYLSVGKAVFGFFGGYVEEGGIDKGTRFFPLQAVQHVLRIPNAAYLAFAALVLGVITLWAWRRATPPESPPGAFLAPAAVLAFFMMLLFSPHYPWYVAWLIPFCVVLETPTIFTYALGLFYLCTTDLAVGYGPKQFQLNAILYSAVLAAFMIEVAIRRKTHLLRPL